MSVVSGRPVTAGSARVDRDVAPEALALLEFESIAAGTRAADALLKKAPVRIERIGTLQPGIFAILWSGDVASVRESFDEALRVAGRAVSDRMFLAQIEPSVYFATLGAAGEFAGDTLGIIETNGLAALIEAADTAVKGANVRVARIRLGDELGGKGVAHLTGEQHDVEAALELAVMRVAREGRKVETSITPRIDPELASLLGRSTRFWEVF
ncbi:MAG: BMC domain-containing protein [Deltaproteobacteria bacterium]|nr:BMC domain-containing protein [Deltaproteobacteria bacterium]